MLVRTIPRHPEFMTGASTVSPHEVSQAMRNGRSIQVEVR